MSNAKTLGRPPSIAPRADDVAHLSVRISAAQVKKLKRTARSRGITYSALVREILEAGA